jgi:hypothetical protein
MATVEQCQQAILMELQMILSTVNDINDNLVRTNKLVEENPADRSLGSYNQVVRENVRVLRDILSVLLQ